MTKKLQFITCAVGISALALTFSGVAFAEDSWGAQASTTIEVHASTTKPRLPIKPLIQDIKGDIKIDRTLIASTTRDRSEHTGTSTDDRGDKMSTTTKGVIQDARKDIHTDLGQIRIIQAARVVWIRINATIVRLGKIVTKLDSRIAKIKTGGADTTVAESYSANAKVSLDTARTDMNDVKSIILSMSSTSPISATATTTIKADTTDAETQIKAAQDDIENALQSLQGLKVNAHASTTVSGGVE